MRYLLIALAMSGLFLSACDKRPATLDRSTLRTIDTLAAKEIRLLRPKLDSLCEVQFDSLVNAAMDSIRIVRRNEIDKILSQ